MNKPSKTPVNSLKRSSIKDKKLTLNFIVKQVEKGTGHKLSDLKENYSEEQLFFTALKFVTTTKKAVCTALGIPVEAGCRYKRALEQCGQLVQSNDKVFCPITNHPAHLISTNHKEFNRLRKPTHYKRF